MSDVSETRGILASSAVMASGTIVSRMSGYVRNLLLAAAIGNELHADLFNIGNTIPNMLYILLAGGVFNAVLVPQLVRAQKGDPDGGEAYTNRVITLALIFLGAVTVLLVIAAPLVMRLYLNSSYDCADLSAPSATRRSRSPATACPRSSSTGCSCCWARSSTPAAASAR